MKRRNGFCSLCPKPVVGKQKLCARCRVAKTREKYKSQGLCLCGREKTGAKTCSICHEKSSKRNAAAKKIKRDFYEAERSQIRAARIADLAKDLKSLS
jgi:hypothetical protein